MINVENQERAITKSDCFSYNQACAPN